MLSVEVLLLSIPWFGFARLVLVFVVVLVLVLDAEAVGVVNELVDVVDDTGITGCALLLEIKWLELPGALFAYGLLDRVVVEVSCELVSKLLKLCFSMLLGELSLFDENELRSLSLEAET